MSDDSNDRSRMASTPLRDPEPAAPGTWRVASYNVENYLDGTSPKGRVKSAESKAAVREGIRAMNPDVLALQEMGGVATLLELRDSLSAEGADYPYWEHVKGADADLHLAILSKFPFADRRPRNNDSFNLSGRRFQVRRGFGEVDIRISSDFSFTLVTAHLKSRNATPEADASELRLEEARLLRTRIDALFAGNPNTNLIVLGDFNDSPESAVVRTIIGQDQHRLIDTCPAERNGAGFRVGSSVSASGKGAWTNFFLEKGEYSRFDYILVSPAMAPSLTAGGSFVLDVPNWATASDHRPIAASFRTR